MSVSAVQSRSPTPERRQQRVSFREPVNSSGGQRYSPTPPFRQVHRFNLVTIVVVPTYLVDAQRSVLHVLAVVDGVIYVHGAVALGGAQ